MKIDRVKVVNLLFCFLIFTDSCENVFIKSIVGKTKFVFI